MLVRRSNPVPPPVPAPPAPRLPVVRRLVAAKPVLAREPRTGPAMGPTWAEIELANVRAFSAVVAAVAFEMRLPASDIVALNRERRLSRARYAVAWLGAEIAGVPLKSMARQMEDRCHTTVLYFRNQGAVLRAGRDPAFKRLTDKIAARFAVAERCQKCRDTGWMSGSQRCDACLEGLRA